MLERTGEDFPQPSFGPKIITVSSIRHTLRTINRGLIYCIAKAALSMLTPLYDARLAEKWHQRL